MLENYFIVETWGGLACFTRPETKVERFSYPVITPSTTRGILDAIYAKPDEFGWRVKKVEVFNPISYIALRRNEVKEKISVSAVKKAMDSAGMNPVVADADMDYAGSDQKGRTQRQTMALKNVRYRVHAYILPRRGKENKLHHMMKQAKRRLEKGKCFYQPYFGCREFPAFFKLIEKRDDLKPADITMDIGLMVYDVFNINKVVTDGTAGASISLFKAKIVNGVMDIPEYDSEEVIK